MRLDKYLVANFDFRSRAHAQEYIRDGKVKINGDVQKKCGVIVSSGDSVEVEHIQRWVSRAALKLIHAFDEFDLSVLDKVCLDIGSSTGGFTQVLLDKGASKVYAVDVGTDQMVEPIRSDERVVLLEQTHIKDLSHTDILEEVDFVAVDVSFISLKNVIPYIQPFMKKDATGVFLLKPQFELGPKALNKHGVVKDQRLYPELIHTMSQWISEFATVQKVIESTIQGASGNVEFLMFVYWNIS